MSDDNKIVLNIVTDTKPIDAAKQSVNELGTSLNKIGENAAFSALQKESNQLSLIIEKLSLDFSELNKENKLLVDKVQNLSTKLKELEGVGKTIPSKTNDMKKGFDALGNSITQVSRELPAFAFSAQTGFAAISNNLPILFDAISKTKSELAALTAEGKAAPSIWQKLGSSIFSLQTGLSVGVTLLTIYGGEIVKAFSELASANKKIDESEIRITSLGVALKAATNSFVENRTSISDFKYNIELVSKGLMSQSTALDFYKSKLESSFGAVNSLAEAEAKLSDPKVVESFIKMQFYKSVALEASKEAAKQELENAKATEKSAAQYHNWTDAVLAAFNTVSGTGASYTDTYVQLSENRRTATLKEGEVTKNVYDKIVDKYRLLSEAEAKQSGLKVSGEKTKAIKKQADEEYFISVELAKKELALTEDNSREQMAAKITLANAEADLAKAQELISEDSANIKSAKIQAIEADLQDKIETIKKAQSDYEISEFKKVTDALEAEQGKREKAEIDAADRLKKRDEQERAESKKDLEQWLKEQEENDKKIAKEKQELQKKIAQVEIEIAQNVSDTIFQIGANKREQEFNDKISKLETEKEKELSNKNLSEKQKESINKKYAEKEAVVKKQAFEADQKAKIAQAVMNGALAITNILANTFDPTGIYKGILIAASAITTASQIAVIQSTPPPKFEKGGLIKGRLHKHGGTLIEAEDGEFVVNRKATAKHFNLLDQINKGMFVPTLSMKEMDNIKYVTNHVSIDYDKLATTLAKKINDRPTSIINIDERGFEKRVVTLRSETSNKSKRYSFSA